MLLQLKRLLMISIREWIERLVSVLRFTAPVVRNGKSKTVPTQTAP